MYRSSSINFFSFSPTLSAVHFSCSDSFIYWEPKRSVSMDCLGILSEPGGSTSSTRALCKNVCLGRWLFDLLIVEDVSGVPRKLLGPKHEI